METVEFIIDYDKKTINICLGDKTQSMKLEDFISETVDEVYYLLEQVSKLKLKLKKKCKPTARCLKKAMDASLARSVTKINKQYPRYVKYYEDC